MKFLRGSTRSPNVLSPTLFLFSIFQLITADECSPVTWGDTHQHVVAEATPTATTKISASVANIGKPIQAGQINCRYSGRTSGNVDYDTCAQLASDYKITVEKFFLLNPDVDPDCGNIQSDTEYCVRGFIEPLRATDGLCGPPHKNATCIGMEGQCCNSESWTCGSTIADCAPGTCYEGSCLGDKVYSTDGTCGYKHGDRLCAGKWGDCCDVNGQCGTGIEFCGINVCQAGNCPRPIVLPNDAEWVLAENMTYGESLRSDCGVDGHAEDGACRSSTTKSTPSNPLSPTSSELSASSTTLLSNCIVPSPAPAGKTCGEPGILVYKNGTGRLSSHYTAPYVTSLEGCITHCLATPACDNIHFAEGRYCALHFGPVAYTPYESKNSQYIYEASCFECPPTVPVRNACAVLSPPPAKQVCGISGAAVAAPNSGLIFAHVMGAYVASIEVCAAQCLATDNCTNIFFIEGSACNLHYGPLSYLPIENANTFSVYEASCFGCK